MLSTLNWQEAIPALTQRGEPWVMATVLGTRGSSPRDAGTKMIISAKQCFDTIGGGQFEYKVIQQARKILSDKQNNKVQELVHFPLATKTKQCCGGAVSVLLESFAVELPCVDLFGAGHVAHALVPILDAMKLRVNWIDNRPELFPDTVKLEKNATSSRVECLLYENTLEHIKTMSPSSIALVMTHDHTLDYQLTSALLDRKDCRFIGLIGSETKALRFKRRLKSDAFSQAEIDAVHCPIGLDNIPGKKPIEIAISIAAQIVQLTQDDSPEKPGSGLSWNQLNKELNDNIIKKENGFIRL